VHVVTACPTIDTALSRDLAAKVRHLCIRKDPVDHDRVEALGFEGTGALIAFAHGAPNNTPRILHKRSSGWAPLFPARVTSATREHFSADESDPESVRARLIQMRQTRLANAEWVKEARPEARMVLLVLAALARPPRQDEAISRRTGLTVLEVQRALVRAASQGWIDGRRRLTDDGQAELAHARKSSAGTESLQTEVEMFYYPTSLRAPSGASS
jgi:hypothetical protein